MTGGPASAADGAAAHGRPSVVGVSGVVRTFGSGASAVRALRGVNADIRQGELTVLTGRSGSGKTTLLNIVGGLDVPDSGTVCVAGQDVTAMTARERTMFRRRTVAFIFQSFGLIPILSAAENVGVPLRIAGIPVSEREERVGLMLGLVGLSEHARQRPNELSGGQQQRVAIARALAGRPQVLIADEPTGQLDSQTGRQIMRLLRTVVRSEGITALVATHDPVLIELADAVLRLDDGMLVTG
ncbi:MAG: ABC transporter ATP-binding protein [Actinomycetota bacterium]|nr:ABC transporter ATP-binding protein [Actinomycetota bacterium]